MLTPDQFVTKYNGQPVEAYDPNNKNQCVDLVTQYCMDVFGLPNTIFAGLDYACNIWTPSTTLAVSKFDYIDNTPTNSPQKGDIIVWSHWYNWTWNFWGAGHTGIATGTGDVNNFQCFVQNDPTGTYSHLRMYNYNCVLGWLRAKAPVIPLTDAQKWQKTVAMEKTTIADSNFRYQVKQME